jgi:hypothetical protein
LYEVCPLQLDVALVLDLSGSIDEFFNMVVNLAREVVAGLPIGGSGVHDQNGVRVAVVVYDVIANVSFYLDNYTTTDDILNALVFRQAGKLRYHHARDHPHTRTPIWFRKRNFT